jgi:hypothetical protein
MNTYHAAPWSSPSFTYDDCYNVVIEVIVVMLPLVCVHCVMAVSVSDIPLVSSPGKERQASVEIGMFLRRLSGIYSDPS